MGRLQPVAVALVLAGCSDPKPAEPVVLTAGSAIAPLAAAASVSARVRKIVAEHLDVAPERVTATANFIDDLGADSLDAVELVMAFEEEFDIEIPDDAAERVLTVGDAEQYIGQRLAQAAETARHAE